MADVEVTCIVKPHPTSSHEHITHLGNGRSWMWTREQVIDSIERNTNSFFVRDSRSNRRADVRVVRPAGRAPYVQTVADGVYTDNLLALNQCPI